VGILGSLIGGVGGFLLGGPPGASLGASLGGAFDSADSQRSAGNQASDAQYRAAQLGIDEQRRQFDAIQKLLQPYVEGGNKGLSGQLDLVGANGPQAQQAAITALQQSPQFTALQQQGENRILANASATGGLRGGNTQAALAQFSPQLLSQLIDQQYGRLGGLTSIGQNAAAGVGNAGMQTGVNVSNLLGQQGAAQAGGYLSAGRAQSGYASGIAGALGQYYGLGGFGGKSGGGINLGGGGIGGFSLSDLFNGTGLGGGL